MVNAYLNKKDLYATVASKVYHNDYWDNMEHHEDGSPNPEGKKRRSNTKGVVLGILYGSGPATVAQQIGSTTQEAQDIINSFYEGFPTVKKWIAETQEFAKKNGYVEDMWGRRRRLPDLNLPKYEVKLKNDKSVQTDFNPLIGALGKVQKQKPELVVKYEEALKNVRNYKEAEKLKISADKEGVKIIDNGAFISTAERQCVNARVQGSAATMSKRAMIAVYNDPKLRELGFRMLIAVHDELIGECPKENAQESADRLAELMIASALPDCTVPMKCDAEITSRWYEDDYLATLDAYYHKLLEKGMTREEALNDIRTNKPESYIFDIEKELQ